MKRLAISLIVLCLVLFIPLTVFSFPPSPPPTSVPAASETVAGKVELATNAETVTGTATDKVTTPANITARLENPGTIGTTPGDGTFSPLTSTAPAAVSSGFAGTVSQATTTLTFTEAADDALVEIGSTVKTAAATCHVINDAGVLAWTCAESQTIALWTAIASIQGYQNRGLDASSNALRVEYADGAEAWISAAGAGLAFRTVAGNWGFGTTRPQAKLEVSVSAEVNIPAAGSDSTYFMLTHNVGGAYGMMAGVLGSGKGYIQQQRFDGTATVYDLLLQPNGGNVGIGTTSPIFTKDTNGADYSRLRHGKLMFDSAVAGTQIAALAETVTNGLFTLGGTNYAAANVTVQAGGAQVTTAAADDDSASILVNMPVLNTTQNPRMSFRFKVDSITNAYVAVGITTAAFADKGTLPDNCALIGIDADNGHALGAARLILTTKDDAAAVDYDDLGSNMASNTWVWGVVDFTDPDQPRVWIAGTEIAAGSISGTVKDATAFKLYFMVQNLAGGTHTLTVVCDGWWQDQPS